MIFKVLGGKSPKIRFSFKKRLHAFNNGLFETEDKDLIKYLSNCPKPFCEAVNKEPVKEEKKEAK